MKKKYNGVDSDFIEVVKSEGIKEKIPVMILILFVMIIFVIFGYFIYGKITQFSNAKRDKPNSVDKNNKKDNSSVQNPKDKTNKKYNNTVDATKKYYCMDGYKLEGDKCIYVYTVSANINRSCNTGKLVGHNCVENKVEHIDVEFYCINSMNQEVSCYDDSDDSISIVLDCPEGYTLEETEEDFICTKETESKVTAIENYSCSEGYTLSGNNCIKRVEIDASYNYICEDGYELVGSKCNRKR